MTIGRLLIANRGEVAVRITRTAAELGIVTVAVYSADDADSRHCKVADEAHLLSGSGVAAYLDIDQLISVAKTAQADAIHPGYGFLSENAEFARKCAENSIIFVGPSPEVLELFGDKSAARKFAAQCKVSIPFGTDGPTSLEEARSFLASREFGAAIMVKALAGGGGRGMRVVRDPSELDEAYRRCQSEAQAAFGNPDIYVEQLLTDVRHIEIQIAADSAGDITHLYDRDCSIQRRHQKLLEIAPSPNLASATRQTLIDAAVRMARAAKYRNLGTFEFLVPLHASNPEQYWFIEANPRLQVEHTITEQILDLDLVRLQIEIARGRLFPELQCEQADIGSPRGCAMQLRVNMEKITETGDVLPTGGRLNAFDVPAGPGVRVDTFVYQGYDTNSNFDSLLAKVIIHSPRLNFSELARKGDRALREFRINGVATNLNLLRALLERPEIAAGGASTKFMEEQIADLKRRADLMPDNVLPVISTEAQASQNEDAVFPGMVPIKAPTKGVVVTIDVKVGDVVRQNANVAVIEAMKSEFLVVSTTGGIVKHILAEPGQVVDQQPILYIEPNELAGLDVEEETEFELGKIRPDLAEAMRRHAVNEDAQRPKAVERRRKTNQRTARENIADLCDAGTFFEYNSLALAAQRGRRSIEELIELSPADGLVCGVGSVNKREFPEQSRCVVISYDYSVFAGTQGVNNHRKQDRMFQLARKSHLPLIFFTEGGGGRPGDTDHLAVNTLETPTFIEFAKLKGLVPLIGINSGRCFAGNAALLGCCDVIIATKNSSIGMGGPAMIEGGGLGVYSPEEVGPVSFQSLNGVIDVVVEDEAEGVKVAKQYLSYFQGRRTEWDCADQRILRHVVPENRLRAYDIRRVIDVLVDCGSMLELRKEFAVGIITAFVRIEGHPIGLIANNPQHMAGAVDAHGSDKAARFIQLCDAFGIPILSLCDTPGFLVGPDAEKQALVRHATRMFIAAANAKIPIFTIVTRKGYGLGALAMTGGNFHIPFFMASWPTGEFGGMGLEGSVRLGYRKELDAIADPVERQRKFDEMVARLYEHGKAINMASFLKVDDVIDPAETRRWIMHGIESTKNWDPGHTPRRGRIDTW